MKNILKRIGLIAVALFLGVGSLFITTPIKSDKSKMASADNSSASGYTFTGSNIELYLDMNDYYTYGLNFKVVLTQITNGVSVDFSRFLIIYADGSNSLKSVSPADGIGNHFADLSYSTTTRNLQLFATVYGGYTRNFKMYYLFGGDSVFNCNVTSVTLGHYSDSNNNYYNFIRYFDDSNNYLEFSFLVSASWDYELLDNRTYYIVVPTGDSAYYEQGVSDGYSSGFSAGESAGYNSGFTAGEQQGYIQGRQDGIESASEFTFLGLMTAVVDAPLLAFTSLFDFDLLGVNLLGFFIGLFTFSLVIIIAKFAIGGK